MSQEEIKKLYKDALIDSMRDDIAKYQEKIYGKGSLPDGIYGYYKALEEMTKDYLINSFLKEHQEWKEICLDDENFEGILEDLVSEHKFWRMKQIPKAFHTLV